MKRRVHKDVPEFFHVLGAALMALPAALATQWWLFGRSPEARPELLPVFAAVGLACAALGHGLRGDAGFTLRAAVVRALAWYVMFMFLILIRRAMEFFLEN